MIRALALAPPFAALLIVGVYSETHAGDEGSPTWSSLKEASPRPSAKEWREATEVTLDRVVGKRAKQCTAWQVREWFKLHCTGKPTAAINLVGGEPRDLYFWVEPPSEDDSSERMPRDGEVVMAVRPGTQRVIQFWTFGPGYDGPLTVLGDVILQQKWEEDDPSPAFILSDTLVEPIRTATQKGK